MELSPKICESRRRLRVSAIAVLLCLVVIAGLAGCSRRVSYNVRELYSDARFSARALSSNDIAVLPLLTSRGAVTEGPLEAGNIVKRLRALRPDLRFVSYENFENSFPPRFDKRQITDFYGKLFREEVLSVKNMDSLWAHVGHPFILVYALRDGARILNTDGSEFMHVTVVCELWSREWRAVVWRASCKGVSDDGKTPDGELLAESMRILAEAIPATAPDYGRESW